MTLLLLIIAMLLVVANGFFVAIEFCLVATSPASLEIEAEAGNRRARSALVSFTDISRHVAGAQLGITMASLALGLIAEPSVEHLVEQALPFLGESVRHTVATVIALLIVVFVHMLIGEMVPKNLALANPARLTMWLMPLHRVFVSIMRPFIWLLNSIATVVLGWFGAERVDERDEARTPGELHMLLDESHGEGVLDEFEHSLMAGALDLGEKTVATVMVPWGSVDSVRRGLTVRALESEVVRTGHSRLPVLTERGPIRVVGLVHAKDLLDLDPDAWDRPVSNELIRPMLWVRDDLAMEDVLIQMQRARRHFAVVLDDAGETIGVVTLEDILESVVGDIIDETDVLA